MFNILPFALTIIFSLTIPNSLHSMIDQQDFTPTTFWDDFDENLEKIGLTLEDPDTAHSLHEVTSMAPLQITEIINDYIFNKH